MSIIKPLLLQKPLPSDAVFVLYLLAIRRPRHIPPKRMVFITLGSTGTRPELQ
jgi:hypothetical protein